MDMSEPHTKIPLAISAATIAVCWLITHQSSTVTVASTPNTVIATEASSAEVAAIESQTQMIKELEKKVLHLQLQASREMNKWKRKLPRQVDSR
jgi:hypothetical protein